MRLSKALASILAAITMVPLMVPSANANCVCKKKIYRTSHRSHPRTVSYTKTRTIYKTSFVPMTHTVYRTQYIPMSQTIVRSNVMPLPVATRVFVPQMNTGTIVTRTTRTEQFVPISRLPEQTILRTTGIVEPTTTRVITTVPDSDDFIKRKITIKEKKDHFRVGSREQVLWY
jgi:hypothetical protein